MFHEGVQLVGYAILIPYWSNEFGGNLLFIDELFVSPAFGAATALWRSGVGAGGKPRQ